MASHATPRPVDYLDEDVLKVPDQAFACISFVDPKKANQKGDVCALKIRGVFRSEEEAKAHASKLLRFDPYFDVLVVDMYRWLPFPPDLSLIGDHQYSDKMLNELMQGYKKSQEEAKLHFEERKRLMIERGLDTVLTDAERVPAPPPNVFDAPPTHPVEGAGPSARV
jgi:hypothetical protein